MVHWRHAFAQPTTYLGIIGIVILLGGAFFLDKEESQRAYEDGIQRGANVTRIFEENISRIFFGTDSQILLLRKLYQRDPRGFDFSDWISNTTADNDLVIQFTIVGLDGKIVSSSLQQSPPTTYVGDQDYFLAHETSSTDKFHISAPIIDRVSKKTAILLSRRLTTSDGSFGGVILASLDVLRLQKFFNTIDVGQNGIISLVGFDGIIRARGGNNGDSNAGDYVGRSVSSSKLFELYPQSSSGHFWNDPNPAHRLDGIRRLISYRAIETLHLFTVVGISEAEVFRRAKENTRIGWSKALFFAAIILIVISIAATRERKLIAAKSALSHQARHDVLTGLANRQAFVDEIENALSRRLINNECFNVFMLDLDRFKHVNDMHGHPIGDALLKETARRLKSSLHDADFLARLGGDEFAIIQRCQTKSQNKNTKQHEQSEVATDLAERIVGCLEVPFEIEGIQLDVGTSIGIAQMQDDNAGSDELMKRADLALYCAKAQGSGSYVIFDRKMMVQIEMRQRLESELRKAISNNELELHYQPIIDVKTRAICSVEALVRWRHPQIGLISPREFMPIAEGTELIVPLGQWVLQRACMDAVAWPADIKVVVNLSTVHFRKGNLAADINRAVLKSGIPSRRLEVDVKESVLCDDGGKSLETMHQLQKLGVTIALDEFGTGSSSLNSLTMFPFDKVKIDRTFILNMTKSSGCAAVIATAITLGRCLNIGTTAVGVVSKQEFESLRVSGIDFVQGYLFGPPCPASELHIDGFCNYKFIDDNDRLAAVQ